MIYRSSPWNGSRRSAATAVEFAVVAPLLFLVVLGIIELGRGYMAAHLLGDSARLGCRAGVIAGTSTKDIETVTNNAATSFGLQGAATTVLVNNSTTTDAVNASSGDEITVIVSVPTKNVTWLPGGGFLPSNLTAQYKLRRE